MLIRQLEQNPMLQQPYNPHPLLQFVIALKTHQTLKSVILPVKRKNKCYSGLCVQLLGGHQSLQYYKRGPRGTAFVRRNDRVSLYFNLCPSVWEDCFPPKYDLLSSTTEHRINLIWMKTNFKWWVLHSDSPKQIEYIWSII